MKHDRGVAPALFLAHLVALVFGLVGLLIMLPHPNLWASDPNATPALVDTCRDGDGTIIKNGDTSYPNDDPMKRCVFAKDSKGNFRFVDGVSAALKFKAVPAQLGDVVDTIVSK